MRGQSGTDGDFDVGDPSSIPCDVWCVVPSYVEGGKHGNKHDKEEEGQMDCFKYLLRTQTKIERKDK